MKWFFGIYCRILYWGFLESIGKKPAPGCFRKLYDLVTEMMNKSREYLRYLNYGYHDLSLSLGRLLPHYEPGEDKYSAQLYAAVITERFMGALKDKRVLEVGCGRGGGIAMVHDHLGVASAVGLDLSPSAIENCRKWYPGRPGLSFVTGDASQLPMADASVDAALNVESAHCYPDLNQFFAQIARVLTKGGHFFFADLMPSVAVAETERLLSEQGLSIVERCDITPKVLEGIKLEERRKLANLEAVKIPASAKKMLREFMGCEGSVVRRRFSEKSLVYVRYVLVKN